MDMAISASSRMRECGTRSMEEARRGISVIVPDVYRSRDISRYDI
jgi:hypothetical protein